MRTKGAQPGNKNASKNRPWTDAIQRALLADDGKRLRAIADKIVSLAEQGDIQAIKELGDRVEGKPAQILAGSGESGEFEHVVRWANEK